MTYCRLVDEGNYNLAFVIFPHNMFNYPFSPFLQFILFSKWQWKIVNCFSYTTGIIYMYIYITHTHTLYICIALLCQINFYCKALTLKWNTCIFPVSHISTFRLSLKSQNIHDNLGMVLHVKGLEPASRWLALYSSSAG